MFRAIIIDDEQIGIEALKTLIGKYTTGVKVVATATDPEVGIALIEDYRPDVVFLDISMPKMDGFELLSRLKYKDFKLVFTTAHEEFALKAIKNKAADYLLKPIDIEELKSCVANFSTKDPIAAVQKDSSHIIELSVKDGIIFIRPRDVIRLEADGSYTTIYLENNVKHVASKNLKECEAMFDLPYFYRCHSSHIVNLHKVVRIISTDGLFAQMTDGSRPEIGRKNKETFLEKLKTI